MTNDPTAQYRIGQRSKLSFYDIQLANAMYKCAGKPYQYCLLQYHTNRGALFGIFSFR